MDDHPLFDAPGTDGSEGQSGKVWFLGGTFLSTEVASGAYLGTADRTITVPKGTALFFPIVNAGAAELENDGDTHLVTGLPSYTQLGMAALLPNEKLQINLDDSATVSVNGRNSAGTQSRSAIVAAGIAVAAEEILQEVSPA